jgi:hypothetical protein
VAVKQHLLVASHREVEVMGVDIVEQVVECEQVETSECAACTADRMKRQSRCLLHGVWSGDSDVKKSQQEWVELEGSLMDQVA